jgi:hypothetical protein
MTKLAKGVTLLIADMAEGERESLTFGALRDTLLPKPISGELRVPFQSDVAAKGPWHEKDQRT